MERTTTYEVVVPTTAPNGAVRFTWDDDAVIATRSYPGEFVIRANVAGLRTLARHLLTLAQDGVSDGAHLHLDDPGGLEPDSPGLVLERDDSLA